MNQAEVEIAKMLLQAGFAGVVMVLLGLIIMAARHYFKRDESEAEERARQEAAENKERERWMELVQKMLDTTLDSQNQKFGTLAEGWTASLREMQQAMQQAQEKALEALVQSMSERMAPITDERRAKLNLIEEQLKVVPAETIRLLKLDQVIRQANDQQVEAVKQAITQALDPFFKRLNDQAESVPVESVRAMLVSEMNNLQSRLLDQVVAQIQPVIERLQDMDAAIKAVKAAQSEPGDARAAKDSIEVPPAGTPAELPANV